MYITNAIRWSRGFKCNSSQAPWREDKCYFLPYMREEDILYFAFKMLLSEQMAGVTFPVTHGLYTVYTQRVRRIRRTEV